MGTFKRNIILYLEKLVITQLIETGTTTSTRFPLKFFRVFSKYRLPGILHFTIFTRKVSTVIFSEGGYSLYGSQNDKTSNI